MSNVDFRIPLYQQLEALIQKKIASREYLPGEKIPSERVLAEKFKINRMTVKRSLNNLVESGLLYRQQGKGTFVALNVNDSYQLSFTHSSSLSSALRLSGRKLSTKILRVIEDVDSPYINLKLGLSRSEKVYGIHRVRLEHDVPFAVEYTYVPAKMFGDILNFDFRHVGLYDYMISRGKTPTFFQQYQILMHPLEREAKLLKIGQNEYVYKNNYSSASQNQEIIEFTESYLSANKVNLSYDVKL